MIWKIVDNNIHLFPIHRHKNRGCYLKASKYFQNNDLTAGPNMFSTDISAITEVEFMLDKDDYKATIQDLYERNCIFGTIGNKPKNYFVTETEKDLSIETEDIITLYDISNRHRYYYFVTEIDEEQCVYKGVSITHNNGEIALKDSTVVEIPFTSYIMEKIAISLENKKRIESSIALIKPEASTPKR